MTALAIGRRGRLALSGYGWIAAAFVAAPILVLVPISFSADDALSLPPEALSLRWFAALVSQPRWRDAALLSIVVAALSAAAATILGTLAAIGVNRLTPLPARLLKVLFVSPMIVPLMVIGVGFYAFFAALGLVGRFVTLPLAHAILCLPLVVLPVLGRLASIDPALERAGASLGAGQARIVLRLLLPLLAPAMLAGFALAFITSFDEVIVAQFLTGPRLETLPRRLWEGLAVGGLDNTITAIATVQVALAVVAILGLEAWRRRRRQAAAAAATTAAPDLPPAPSPVAAPVGGRGVAIVFDRLSKTYGAAAAVEEASLSIAPGEFLTILGPSGSGKTTLLMLIAGFVAPTGGRLLIGGDDVSALPPHRRDLGLVFQNYALFPHLTVTENIAFPLRARRMPEAEIGRRVAAALALVRLEGLGGRRPFELSGGQQQRVAFARAVVFDPRALLMDEPLSALDRSLRLEMQAELRRLQRSVGQTAIYVTHDQEEALNLSDRIAVMNHGRLQQVGTPHALYFRPANAFVAGFFGEANLIRGTADGTTLAAAGSGLAVPLPSAHHGATTLCIRPEAVRLVDGPGDGPTVEGHVVEARFSGAAARIVVATPLGPMAFTLPSGESAALPEPGRAVRLGWDVRASHAMEGS